MSPTTAATKSTVPEKRAAASRDDDSATHSPAACLDCRSRKVKCNRTLPTCSNCKRSGVPCRFPNPEKKASQMKQLTEDVAQFNNRLSSIEMSLVGRVQELTELVSQSIQDNSGKTRTGSLSKSSHHSSSDQDDTDMEDDDPTGGSDSPHSSCTSSTTDRPSSVIVANGPGERFYGPCSTYSHMVHSKGLVEKLLTAGEQPGSARLSQRSNSCTGLADANLVQGTPAFSEVRRRYESFSGPSNFQESFEQTDQKPLELPPRQILEDAIEDYVSEYSLEPPLFDKQTLATAVAEQYSAHASDVDESWVLCFNNIILRSPGWRSRAFRFNSFAASRVDPTVLPLLLGNANRALRHLEKFCALRLVNIQALLLLALVGRDLIHYNVFARIFDRVCQLAKQMGLHEREHVSENGSAEDIQAQNVLWILYLVDKNNAFIRGPPCRIYKFECHLRLPTEGTVADQFVAYNLRLSCLIEETYRHLYSPKALKLASGAQQRRVERLDGRLANLTHQVEKLVKSGNLSSAENFMGSHLNYGILVTRLLILSRSGARKNKETRRETARSALQIIQALSEGGFDFDGAVVVLERLFCNCSVIAFHEIFESLMTESPSADTLVDLELLKCTTRTLKMIAHSDRPYSYLTRLHKNFVWCTEIAALVSDSRRSSPAPPMDRRLSASSSANSSSHMSHRNSTSIQQQRPAPQSSQFPSNRTTPPQDLGGDILMQDDLYGGPIMDPMLDPLITTTSAMNAPDASLTAADFASLHTTLQPQDYMFTGGNDDFDLGGGLMANQFGMQSDELSPPIEHSARFQEALKYVLSMGGGGPLDSSFPPGMSDQVPAMLPYNRNIARPSN